MKKYLLVLLSLLFFSGCSTEDRLPPSVRVLQGVWVFADKIIEFDDFEAERATTTRIEEGRYVKDVGSAAQYRYSGGTYYNYHVVGDVLFEIVVTKNGAIDGKEIESETIYQRSYK